MVMVIYFNIYREREREREIFLKLKKKKKNLLSILRQTRIIGRRMIKEMFSAYLALDMSSWALEVDGRAGIAPFFVVQIAPHAFANVRASLSFASSYAEVTKLS